MATVVDLDCARSYMTEPAFHVSKLSMAIDGSNAGKQLVYKWYSGVWTLYPINLSPEFLNTPKWEAAKFRLADIECNLDWWGEHPDNRHNWDYFIHASVKAENAPHNGEGLLHHLDPIPALSELAATAITKTYNLDVGTPIGVLISKQSMPANQGYVLRVKALFRLEGLKNSDLCTFVFGDYAVKLKSSGQGLLYNTIDYKKWSIVKDFKWSAQTSSDQLEEIWITIFPHHGDQIEIHFANNPQGNVTYSQPSIASDRIGQGPPIRRYVDDVESVHGVIIHDVKYEKPRTGNNPVITAAGPWSLFVDRTYRPMVQVSKLIYFDGGATKAELYDHPIPFRSGPPRQQVRHSVESRSNGGLISSDLRNGSKLPFTQNQPFQSDGFQDAVQFHATFSGKGDYIAAGTSRTRGSSTTPELYSYTIDKQPGMARDERDVSTFPTLSVRIDHGDTPENERASLTVDNSLGQANAFRRRAHIPLKIYDDVSGIVYFEGFAISVRSQECSSEAAPCLEIEARGMADTLLRNYALQLDFTQDGLNSGVAWKWQDALRQCFTFGGYDGLNQIRFEDVDGSSGDRWNFPLWTDGDTKSDGSKDGPNVSDQRWRPNPKVPIYQFISYLIEDILGWHWHWDREASQWVVFKRPRPGQTKDVAPAVRFFSTDSAMGEAPEGVPKQKHQKLVVESARPECTTVQMHTIMEVIGLDKAALQVQYGQDVSENSAGQPLLKTQLKQVVIEFENYKGFKNAVHPEADETGIDYLGGKTVRPVSAMQISNKEALKFLGQRAKEDLTHGSCIASFVSDWGDENTSYLRKYQPVEIDEERWLIDRIEPAWTNDRVKLAKYYCSLERDDAPPPR